MVKRVTAWLIIVTLVKASHHVCEPPYKGLNVPMEISCTSYKNKNKKTFQKLLYTFVKEHEDTQHIYGR